MSCFCLFVFLGGLFQELLSVLNGMVGFELVLLLLAARCFCFQSCAFDCHLIVILLQEKVKATKLKQHQMHEVFCLSVAY